MSFLMGSTKARSNVNEDAQGTYSGLIDYINKTGFGGLNPGMPDPSQVEPYRKLFADQNAQNFGQVKESAGNLTGSGLCQNLGLAAQRATTEQGAFLTNFLEQKRQADANRWMQIVFNALNSQAAGVTYTHQPGLLDYAVQGASAAAPFLAGPAGPAIAAGTSAASAAAGGSGAAARANPTGGQLGQASFYRFLKPGDPLYAQEGTRMAPYTSPQFPQFFGGDRDIFGTANRPRRY